MEQRDSFPLTIRNWSKSRRVRDEEGGRGAYCVLLVKPFCGGSFENTVCM
jgi:hypothetical protein